MLLSDLGPVMPVVVYTGPTRSPSQLATLSSDIAAEPDKKKTKHHKATAAKSNDDQPAPDEVSAPCVGRAHLHRDHDLL